MNTTLYRWFAIVGGAYTVGSVLAAAVLAWRLRGQGLTFRLAAAGAACLALGFVSWLLLVQLANAQVAEALEAAPPAVPGLWMQLRERWEAGHATGFLIQLLGFAALLASMLSHTQDAVNRASTVPSASNSSSADPATR